MNHIGRLRSTEIDYLFNHCGHGGCQGGLDEAAAQMHGTPNEDYNNPTISEGGKLAFYATGALAASPALALLSPQLGVADLAVTAHGALRLGMGAGRAGTLTSLEVLSVRNEAAMLYRQADGALVRVMEVSLGKFNAVVEGAQGIVTTMRHFSQRAMDQLARKYEWTPLK